MSNSSVNEERYRLSDHKNLSLNLTKSEEIVFIAKRSKSHFQTPETLNGLSVSSILKS